jgi:protein TonB
MAAAEGTQATAKKHVVPARLIHFVKPKYRNAAREAGITGTVVLKGVIAKDGTATELEYVSGPPSLSDSAIKAVKQWRYRSTVVNGEAKEVETTISVIFAIP